MFILPRVFEAFQSSLHGHVTNIFYARPILYVPRFLNPFRSVQPSVQHFAKFTIFNRTLINIQAPMHPKSTQRFTAF